VTKVDYVGVSRHLDRHQIEFAVVLLIRTFRSLTGLRLTPTAVRLTHLRKHIDPEVMQFFGGNVTFGASADEVAFAALVGDLPVLSADYHLNRLLIEHCEQAVAYRRPNRGAFRLLVENAIVPLLPHGRVHAGRIALRLGMSQRTLARRLSSEGLTFSDLLDGLRADLARRYIADERISMSEITWLLGYQEASSFTHAFRRWTGMAPRQARSRAA
jgi:AraC-like DNA-binding protein